MGPKTESKIIDNIRYEVTQLTQNKSMPLLAFIIKKIGPVLTGALSTGSLKSLLATDALSVLPSLNTLFVNLESEDLRYLCRVLGETTEVVGTNGKVRLTEQTQDIFFAGKLLTMFKWLGFALEVNFADFLSVLKSVKDVSSTAQVNAAPPSQAVSTGSSGESLPATM